MRYLYTWLFRLAMPVIFIRLLWRSYRMPAYRKRWRERLAWFEFPKKPDGIWVHAVSLGESIAAIPLITALLEKYPELSVTVTNMTPTGSEKIRAALGDRVFNCYLPYDLPGILKRFMRKVEPRLIIIMETELWPNLLHYAHKAGIPVCLANGRLSPRSAAKYQKIQALARSMLCCLDQLAVQTEAEAQRYIRLGARPESVIVTGNIKFDLQLPRDLEDKAQGLRRLLGEDRLIWIAASTHEGEEDVILDVFAELKKELQDLLLMLVPRHPERFAKVAHLCRKRNYKVILRSESQACDVNTNIFIGNTLGEMLLFYAAADVAFVGGSLVPVGGHNLLEPAALAKAVVTGPYTHNFSHITELLLSAGAIQQIQNSEELKRVVSAYLRNKALRLQAGMHGQAVVQQNRGALAKHLQIIENLLRR